MALETRLFINNEYVPSVARKTFPVNNPATEATVAEVHEAGSEDVDAAVAAAAAAFKTWKKTSSAERSALLLRYADLVEKKTDELAHLETISMGMPRSLATRMIGMHVSTFRYYAGLTDKIHGESYMEDGDDGLLKMINYQPMGVCAGISAWNGTPLQAGWKIAPALAAGNTFVHKSSEKSPLGSLAVGALFKEAGFPPGVVNLLSGAGPTGALMSSHMGIARMAFTGSIGAGRKVQRAAADSNLKPVTLELGGKSASIVFEDAEIDNALLHNSTIFLANNAQACSAASRLFVHESIAPSFIEALKGRFAAMMATIGDPEKDETFLGPMVDKAQRDRVYEYIDGAKAEGIETLIGGEKMDRAGYYATPTVFLNPDLKSRVYREEIFGPVLVVRTFKTEDEVVDLANDTDYGLSGIVFTSNISRGLRVASKLEIGTVSINCAHFPSKQTSWGGWKQSGYGREGGLEAIKECLHAKSVHININA